jgi:hypothetical protein
MRSAKELAVQQIRRILVAIGDLQRAPKNELRKAGTLARASGASVELFHAIDQADPARSFPETATAETVEKLRSAIAARHLRRLDRFAHDESLRGASVTCAAVWGYPPYEAVIRRALASRADEAARRPVGVGWAEDRDEGVGQRAPSLLIAGTPSARLNRHQHAHRTAAPGVTAHLPLPRRTA